MARLRRANRLEQQELGHAPVPWGSLGTLGLSLLTFVGLVWLTFALDVREPDPLLPPSSPRAPPPSPLLPSSPPGPL